MTKKSDLSTKEIESITKDIGKAFRRLKQEKPDDNEEFENEDELSVYAREYPEQYDLRKEQLTKENTKKFDDLYPTSGLEGVVTSDYETADELVVEFFTTESE